MAPTIRQNEAHRSQLLPGLCKLFYRLLQQAKVTVNVENGTVEVPDGVCGDGHGQRAVNLAAIRRVEVLEPNQCRLVSEVGTVDPNDPNF